MMPITKEPAYPPSKSFDGSDLNRHASFANNPQPLQDSNRTILPKWIHRNDRGKCVSLFERVHKNLNLLDPPQAPEIDKDTLQALGLLEFVNLRFPMPVASHRKLLAEFISFFKLDWRCTFFRGDSVFVKKDVFGDSLKLPSKALSRRSQIVPPKDLSSAAMKFMEAYILPVHKKTRKFINNDGFSDQVGRAMIHVKQNRVYRIDWLSLILEEALKEIAYMIDDPPNENISMDCFYSAYWLRFIWENKPNVFPEDIDLESSVRASATNVPLEKEGTSSQASMADYDVRRMEGIDKDGTQDGHNVNVKGNLCHHLEGLRTKSSTSLGEGGGGMNLILAAIEDIGDLPVECNDSVTKTPAKNASSIRHMITSNNGTQTSSKKQKTCKVTTNKNLLIRVSSQGKQGHSSLEHMEAQVLWKKAMCMSAEDEVATFLKAPTNYLDDWAATKNIERMSQIKQKVEETVQKYVESVATTFDPSTLPSPPKKLDQAPGAALKLPESACSSTEYVFRHVIIDLKNLQMMATEEKFNQKDFLKEVTTMLSGWEKFFSCHFTEEIKQMITKIKILKKELDESGHQETIQGLSKRNEEVVKMLMKASLVREEITNSGKEIREMEVARIKSQKSLSELEIVYKNSIQERERKIAEETRKIEEEKKNLGLIHSLKNNNLDFFTKEEAVKSAIASSATNFKDITTKGDALTKEIAKIQQQVEENRSLPAMLRALRSLIACYSIKE